MTDSIANDLRARELAEQAARALAEQVAERAAERAAMKAVEMTFLYLGIDIKDKAALADLKEDLAFLKRTSRGASQVKKVTISTCVGAAVAAFIAIVTLGIKDTVISWVISGK